MVQPDHSISANVTQSRNDTISATPCGTTLALTATLMLGVVTDALADTSTPWREVNRAATQAIHLGQFADGERLALQAFHGCPTAGAEALLCASISLQNAADGAAGLGHPADAEADLRRALAIRRAGLAAGHALIADEELRLGMFLYRQNRPAEAEPLLQDAAAIMRRTGPAAADNLVVILSWWENTLLALGRNADAVVPATEAQALATQTHGALSDPALFAALNRIAILRRADRSDQALDVALAALNLPGIETTVPHWRVSLAGQAAQAAHEIGRPDPARAIATAALKLADAPGADAASTVTLLVGLSRLAADADDNATALAFADRAVGLARGGVPSEAGVTLLERGLARAASGDPAGALADLDAAMPGLGGPNSQPDRMRAVTTAARAETTVGHPENARARLETALTAEAAAPPGTLAVLHSDLAASYLALGDPARAVTEQACAASLLQGAPGFEAPLLAAYRRLAVMRLDLGDVSGAQEAATRAISVAGDTPAIAQERPGAFAVAALVAAHALDVPQARKWADQAEALIDAAHADARQAAALGILAQIYADIALTPASGARAAAIAERARAAYEALGVRDWTLADVTRELGQARIWQNRAAEAETLCRDAGALYRSQQEPQASELARAALCIGWAQYAQGAFAAAEQTLGDGVMLLRAAPHADAAVMVELSDRRGVALLALGQLEDARQIMMAARTEALAAGAGGTVAYTRLLASLGSVLRRTNDIEAARAIDAEAVALLDRIGQGGGDTGLIRAEVLDSEGQITQASGQTDEATHMLDEAARLRHERGL